LRILFIADVFGGPGRKAVGALLPGLKKEKQVDFCILNAENAAGGFGLTVELADEFKELGADMLTTGNHIWDRKEIYPHLENRRDILRPLNYPPQNPGRGAGVYHLEDGRTVGVINLQGRVFMKDLDCPFRTVLPVIEKLKEETQIVVVDFHAEASAEKVALGWYLDGKVSALIGTHTHIQTADERVLPGGTGYITDAGMSGSVDGVIGVKKELAIKRFLTQTPNRFQPADSNLVMMGVVLTVDDETGSTEEIERFQIPSGD
jgi:metallophosphoesterase (TIGR00282 family)